MTLHFTHAAELDYSELWTVAHRDYPAEAAKILSRFRDALDHIQRHPLATTLVEPTIRGRKGLRCFAIPNVGSRVIYLEVHGDTVQIIRILHERMDATRALGA